MTSSPFKSWSRFFVALAGVWAAVALFGVIPQGADYVLNRDRVIYDGIIRSGGGPEEREDFVLLGIDEASMSLSANLSEAELAESPTLSLMQQRFPWDRRVWAELIDRLCESGAKLVVLDLVFAEPGTPEEDDAMAAAIARHPDKVILGSALSPVGQQDGHPVFTLTEPYVQFLESDPEPRLGFVNFWPELSDGSTRFARYRTTLGKENRQVLKGEPALFSLAAQIMDAYGVEIPEGDQELRFASELTEIDIDQYDMSGADVYKARPIYEIFSKSHWERNYDGGKFFKDKMVMVGPVAARFQDIHETPVGKLPGPQLHMQAAACGLAGAYVHHLGSPVWVMTLLGLIAAALAGGIERPRWSALAIVLLLVGFATGVWLLGKHQSLMVPVVGPLIAAIMGWISALVYQLIRERMEKGRIRGSFRRFVSRDVVDRLVDQPEAWQAMAAGRKRQVVVLFSDVRGFTSYSEQIEPTKLVVQLNQYFSAMVDVVFRHGGTLDKFIGDAVMAHWGALDDDSDGDHARAALAAAREMQVELKRLNQAWEREGRQAFKMGIGVHLGEAVAGEIGSAERIEFSVIGDAVNLASRLEGLTKAFDCDIVFSDSVQNAAQPSGATALGPVKVKGRSQAVELHAYGEEKLIQAALEQMERDEAGAIVMRSK